MVYHPERTTQEIRREYLVYKKHALLWVILTFYYKLNSRKNVQQFDYFSISGATACIAQIVRVLSTTRTVTGWDESTRPHTSWEFLALEK